MNAFNINKVEAIKLLHAEKHDKAIKYFTEALAIQPSNVECLISRGICYLHAGLIDKAAVDSHLAAKLEPKNQKAIYQKAEVYYIKGEFEKALLLYHKGRALRPEDDKFRLGIQRSELAISNCLGKGSSTYINADPDQSGLLMAASDDSCQASPPSEKKSVETINALLSELSHDRLYLEDIVKEEGNRLIKFKEIPQPKINEKKSNVQKSKLQIYNERGTFKRHFSSFKIKEAAIHCTNYLDPRADFWQQYQPFYSRKGKNRRIIKPQSINKEKTNWTAHNVLLELVHIEMLGFQGDYLKAIDKAKNIVNILDDVQGIEGQNHKIILSDLYSIIGNSYFKVSNYKDALKYHELDRANGMTHNIKDAVSRSMDYLGSIYFIQNDFNAAITIWTEKVQFAVSNLELSWLYHEIGRCFFFLENYELALQYAYMSLDKANQGMDENWQMNANILIGNSLANLNRLSEAIETYMKASDLSKCRDWCSFKYCDFKINRN